MLILLNLWRGPTLLQLPIKPLDHAKKNNFDYLLIDTAGRLQNKKNLMDEFKKITKVVKKIDPAGSS